MIVCSSSIDTFCIYHHIVDLWSFGLIIHELLEGRHPYLGQGSNILNVIQTKPLDLSRLKVNNAGKALLRGLLEQDPQKRTWEMIEKNLWFQVNVNKLQKMVLERNHQIDKLTGQVSALRRKIENSEKSLGTTCLHSSELCYFLLLHSEYNYHLPSNYPI